MPLPKRLRKLAAGLAAASFLVSAPLLSACGPSVRADTQPETSATNGDYPRPPEDLARDELRKPQQVMDFFEIEPGDTVAELMTGKGWYSLVLANRVGPTGKVIAHNTPFTNDKFRDKLDERLGAEPPANIELLVSELDPVQLDPESLDAVLIIRFYHDLYWMEVDRQTMNEALFKALKPGGIYAVIDYSGREGTAGTEGKTLHRVEEAQVRTELEAAGFEFVDESDLLRNPDDPLDTNIFDKGGDHADRFALKYRKPL